MKILFFIICMIFFHSCSIKKDCFDYLNIYSLKSVKKNVIFNIQKKDYRFICINGMGKTIPGNISPDNKIFKLYGYKCICIDDSNKTVKHTEKLKELYKYATKYNLILLEKLQNYKLLQSDNPCE